MPVTLLSERDIFDVYGCQELLQRPFLGDDDRATVHGRVFEIHAKYVEASKARIRSEAKFVGAGVDLVPTLAEMMGKMRQILSESLMRKQMAGGQVNLMQEVIRANQMAGVNMKGVDLARFGVKELAPIEKPPEPDVDPTWFTKSHNSRIWENPRWVDISTAYLELEKAVDPNSMILTIDRLNQLQHNSFHLLIDLQSGRMLEGRSEGDNYGQHDSARLNVQKVLNLCARSNSAYDFLDNMSGPVASLLRRYRPR
jgi:hypothetical protein